MTRNEVKKGDIYFADLSPSIGSEQSGRRPVLIVQNNIGNKFSPTVIAAARASARNLISIPFLIIPLLHGAVPHLLFSAGCGYPLPYSSSRYTHCRGGPPPRNP